MTSSNPTSTLVTFSGTLTVTRTSGLGIVGIDTYVSNYFSVNITRSLTRLKSGFASIEICHRTFTKNANWWYTYWMRKYTLKLSMTFKMTYCWCCNRFVDFLHNNPQIIDHCGLKLLMKLAYYYFCGMKHALQFSFCLKCLTLRRWRTKCNKYTN